VSAAIGGSNRALDWVVARFPGTRASAYGRLGCRPAARSGDVQMDATAIAETEARFRADPSTARSTPTVTASLVNGRARLSAGPFNWDADLPPALGGENLAPSPTAYLLGALAGCAVAFLHDTLAPRFDVQIDDVTAVARCSSDQRGLLGLDGVAPDLGDLAMEIRVASTSPEDRVEAMLAAWRERCPIYLALLKPQSVALSVARGGSAD
jgi:uncharacterized OsmC-like protein